jgi:catechol 2,3-dioxygenase-like lactoylglutathione lyase family enzyme
MRKIKNHQKGALMITGLDHIHYISNNLEEMVKYFEKVIGGKETSRTEVRGYPMVRMDVFGTTISFLGTEPNAALLDPGKGKRGLDHIGFKVKNLEATLEDLKKKGAKVAVGPNVTPAGVKFAFIDGPEGIRIELVEKD